MKNPLLYSLLLLIILISFYACSSEKNTNDIDFNEDAKQVATVYNSKKDIKLLLGMKITDFLELTGEPFSKDTLISQENTFQVYSYEDGDPDSPGSHFYFKNGFLYQMILNGPDFETWDGYRSGSYFGAEMTDGWALLEQNDPYELTAFRYYDSKGILVENKNQAVIIHTLCVYRENKTTYISISLV